MKTVFYIIIFVVFLLIAGRTTVSFSSFHFHIERPFALIGSLFMGIAVACLCHDAYQNGYKKGYGDAPEARELDEKLDKYIDELTAFYDKHQ
ncbi:hypothetical protein [Prevotella sp. HUN102]|uniref:hypothetical protein n=1 Tax=Prevotella sp. HUN102 TaxID=1392486 RepID=UPI000B21BE51|nr:hypothetical protein [Prevotella sp. HUN102]